MAQDINLLPEISEAEVKSGAYRRKINFTAVASLLVVAAILLALFGYWLFLAAQSRRIDSQTKEAESVILSQSRKEITRRSLVEKLDEVDKFISGVIPYSEAVEGLIDMLKKSSTKLQKGVFLGANISVTGEVAASKNFKTFVDQLISEASKEAFGNVLLTSFRKEEDEPYVFTIEMDYLKQGVPEASPSSSGQQ